MADHFRNLLTSETNNLIDLCKKWEAINENEDEIPDEVRGEIRSTVGCAQLLMNERFKQFSGLIDNNEFNLGEQPTTEEDLQGFWDLVYIQVEDVNKKFSNLDKLRSNNWQDTTVICPPPLKPKIQKKKVPSMSKKPVDQTRIMAARKRLAEAKALAAKNRAISEEDGDNEKENLKTFDAPAFFSVSSPVKKPLPPTTPVESDATDSRKKSHCSFDVNSEFARKNNMTPKKSSPCPKSLLCINKLSPSIRRALGPIGTTQAQQIKPKLEI